MHFTSYTFCQAGSECHPVLRIRFLHHGRDLRTGHLTFWDPFLVDFEESERVQGSFLCKGVKGKGSQKLSSLFTVGTSWISHGISLQRLGVWECKRPFMKLDILGFLMALEWTNLGKYFERYSLCKRALLAATLPGWKVFCVLLYALCFMLLYLFLLFGWMFSLFYHLNMIVKAPYKLVTCYLHYFQQGPVGFLLAYLSNG